MWCCLIWGRGSSEEVFSFKGGWWYMREFVVCNLSGGEWLCSHPQACVVGDGCGGGIGKFTDKVVYVWI